jgi:aspartyl-tRNA(Asn)/glutamyl-tRNA(Gln) amidotransferase subunit A
LKGTYGRIPLSPKADVEPLTVSKGCLARSVRDTARFFDVTNGHDPRDPRSFPRVDGYEAGLGTHDLKGLRVAVIADLGTAVISDAVRMVVDDTADALIRRHHWTRVDLDLGLTQGGWEWSIAGCIPVLSQLGDLWPDCQDLLTPEMRFGLKAAAKHGSMDAMITIDRYRKATVEQMARAFEQVDLIICATNPDIAFGAEGPMATSVDGVDLIATLGLGPALSNNGALTIACNTSGNPAISIPAGTSEGLPIGVQVIAPHHAEALLLDVALSVEREQPWPLVASLAPC